MISCSLGLRKINQRRLFAVGSNITHERSKTWATSMSAKMSMKSKSMSCSIHDVCDPGTLTVEIFLRTEAIQFMPHIQERTQSSPERMSQTSLNWTSGVTMSLDVQNQTELSRTYASKLCSYDGCQHCMYHRKLGPTSSMSFFLRLASSDGPRATSCCCCSGIGRNSAGRTA